MGQFVGPHPEILPAAALRNKLSHSQAHTHNHIAKDTRFRRVGHAKCDKGEVTNRVLRQLAEEIEGQKDVRLCVCVCVCVCMCVYVCVCVNKEKSVC